ncbi:MAG: hypothetical protein NTX29_13570 [Actinobacteria bacterium]|nr:hypothetical protein [Actinomycetota bacterium]
MRTQQGAVFEFSTCSLDVDTTDLKAAECRVVSEHREQFGTSPFASCGRMPDGWVKSTGNTSALVASGRRRRGFADPLVHRTPDYPCVLDRTRTPVAPDWAGLQWSDWAPLASAPAVRGVYRVRRSEAGELVYVGQGIVAARLRAHAAKSAQLGHRQAEWFSGSPQASWVALEDLTSQQLLEVECDLIASHVVRCGHAPAAQFLG